MHGITEKYWTDEAVNDTPHDYCFCYHEFFEMYYYYYDYDYDHEL